MFSPTTSRRLAQAAALTNTAAGDHGGRTLPERLEDVGQLTALLPDEDFGGPESGGTLRAVRKLRAAVAGIWHDAAAQDVGAALEGINHLLTGAGPVRLALPAESDAGRPGTATTGQGAAGRTAWEATARTPAVLTAGREGDPAEKDLSAALALALAEVALAGELTRLRTCSGEECDNAFVDLTRNRSKQFCDEANCANRAHVRAYRARRAAETGDSGEAAGGAEGSGAVTADARKGSGGDAAHDTGKGGKKSARKAGKSGKKSGKKKSKKGGK